MCHSLYEVHIIFVRVRPYLLLVNRIEKSGVGEQLTDMCEQEKPPYSYLKFWTPKHNGKGISRGTDEVTCFIG